MKHEQMLLPFHIDAGRYYKYWKYRTGPRTIVGFANFSNRDSSAPAGAIRSVAVYVRLRHNET